jgi:hypothetical protein
MPRAVRALSKAGARNLNASGSADEKVGVTGFLIGNETEG